MQDAVIYYLFICHNTFTGPSNTKEKRKKKKKEQSRNTLQSTRPQNYVQCKLTGDTSLHCQMRYPKLGCFTVYLLGRKRVTMILNSNIIIQFTVGLIQKELKGFN